jgi:hypothetical protein
MRSKLLLAFMLVLAPLAQAHAEEYNLGAELKRLAPQPPPRPPAEVRPSKDELIAMAKESAANELPILIAELTGAATHGDTSKEWQFPNRRPLTGVPSGVYLKSMDEMRAYWGTYFDILKRSMPGVTLTLKYWNGPSYDGEPSGCQITASW